MTTAPSAVTGCSGSIFATQDGITYCVTDWDNGTSDDQTSACNSYNTKPCSTDDNTANLYIDVNGDKKPNKLTKSADQPKDIYEAQIYN